MLMTLMALCISVFTLAVVFAAFVGAASRDEREARARQAEIKPTVTLPVPRFFADSKHADAPRPRVPVEVLLMEIERHVRLEQAAAESFCVAPTAASLHSPTTSQFVN